jgi:putative flippase GtrA
MDGRQRRSIVNTLLQAQRFLLIGGANTIVGVALVYALLFLGLGATESNFIGYAITIPVSYVAHSRISFQRKEIRLQSFSRYLVAVLLSYLSNFLLLIVLTKTLSINRYLAQIPAFATYAIVFFLLGRFFVFPQNHALESAGE